MNMVDTSNRWVYKGSVTTPPCTQSVYWNVVKQVYPIKKRHYDQYINQLKRAEHSLYATGNWRLIQPLDDHDVQMMVTPEIDNQLIENLLIQY